MKKEKCAEQNIHVINAKKDHLGSCTLREEQSDVVPLNWVGWYGGRRQEIKGINQKGWGGGVGKMRKGGVKPTPNPLSHTGQRKSEGPAGMRSMAQLSSLFGFQMVTTSYLFGQQGEGAHVGTWRAS